MKHYCLLALLIPLAACRTTGGPEADLTDASSSTAPVVSLFGATANAIYEALNLPEEAEGAGTVKRYGGRLAIFCQLEGAPPPGAQGSFTPYRTECQAGEPVISGTSTFPPPPFLTLDGNLAAQFWDEVRVEKQWSSDFGIYTKTWSSESATFECRKVGSHATCTVSDASSSTPDNGGSTGGDSSLLTLGGSGANAAFAAMQLQAVTIPGGQEKRHQGRIIVACKQVGGLPPGQHGQPGPLHHECTAQVPVAPGTQDFAPPPFMRLNGDAAQSFWESFHAESHWGHDSYEKVFTSQSATFVCRKMGSTATCELKDGV